jgi:hypothetical protein
MRYSRPCTSNGFRAAALGDFWLVITSPVNKSLCAAEPHRADMVRARRRWLRQQGFLDSGWCLSTRPHMVRVRARCPRGERRVSHVPQGAMNGPAFLAYIEQCLGPTLRPGEIVVIDNCAVHKVGGVKEVSKRAEHDLNICQPTHRISIQLVNFNTFKAYRRRSSELWWVTMPLYPCSGSKCGYLSSGLLAPVCSAHQRIASSTEMMRRVPNAISRGPLPAFLSS